MTEKQEQLIKSSDGALVALNSWHTAIIRNNGECDLSKMIASAINIFTEMRKEWTLAIGHPQYISRETMNDIVNATAEILKQRIADGTL